jgi:uncharacterized membrane protein
MKILMNCLVSAALWVLGVVVGSGNTEGDVILVSAAILAVGTISTMVGRTLYLKREAGDFRALGEASKKMSSVVDGQFLLKAAIAAVGLLLLWMFSYETLPGGFSHRNRVTGFVCSIDRSCWFSN